MLMFSCDNVFGNLIKYVCKIVIQFINILRWIINIC